MAHNAVDNQSEIAELSGLQIMLLICLFSEKIRSPAFERVKTDKVVDWISQRNTIQILKKNGVFVLSFLVILTGAFCLFTRFSKDDSFIPRQLH